MSYLSKLLDSTRARVAEGKRVVSGDVLEQRLAAIAEPRDLVSSLAGPAERGSVAVIGEIKRASPSKGVFDANLSAGETASAYARGGAAAISVLTEPEYFRGSLDDITAASRAGLPVLRKDFILESWQVLESRAAGADALLLIVRALGRGELGALLAAARALGMEALVECHTEDELRQALDVGARVVGVNHRDLETFEVDDSLTERLAPLVPEDVILVGLSGVATRSDVDALVRAGAGAVLVGEALVRSGDPEAKMRELAGGAA